MHVCAMRVPVFACIRAARVCVPVSVPVSSCLPPSHSFSSLSPHFHPFCAVLAQFKLIEASQQQKQILRGITGSRSVPQVFVHGKYIGGCNDGPEAWMGVMPMLRGGKLQEMLAEGGAKK